MVENSVYLCVILINDFKFILLSNWDFSRRFFQSNRRDQWHFWKNYTWLLALWEPGGIDKAKGFKTQYMDFHGIPLFCVQCLCPQLSSSFCGSFCWEGNCSLCWGRREAKSLAEVREHLWGILTDYLSTFHLVFFF